MKKKVVSKQKMIQSLRLNIHRSLNPDTRLRSIDDSVLQRVRNDLEKEPYSTEITEYGKEALLHKGANQLFKLIDTYCNSKKPKGPAQYSFRKAILNCWSKVHCTTWRDGSIPWSWNAGAWARAEDLPDYESNVWGCLWVSKSSGGRIDGKLGRDRDSFVRDKQASQSQEMGWWEDNCAQRELLCLFLQMAEALSKSKHLSLASRFDVAHP